MKRFTQMTIIAVLTLLPLAAFAGNIDSPGTPPTSGSGMPSLEDMYNYLNRGAPWTAPDPDSFQEPSAAPAPTVYTLKEMYDKLKQLFKSSTARPEQVLETVKFFNTDPLNWGVKQGTIPILRGAVTITPGTTDQPIPKGYRDGTGIVRGDPDLIPENIKPGVTIFGVTNPSYSSVRIPCPGVLSSGGRWCDVRNGTVLDMTTGLIWLEDASCWRKCTKYKRNGKCKERGDDLTFNWDQARDKVATLESGQCGLKDRSDPGQWRLPTKDELEWLTQGSEKILSGSPGPFSGVKGYLKWDWYWSSTEYFGSPCPSTEYGSFCAWSVRLKLGSWQFYGKPSGFYVWPVRDGQ